MAQTNGKADPAQAKTCFMITPIGNPGSAIRKHADWVFKYVKDACDARDIKLDRADTMIGSPMITTRIFEAVRSADYCVADLTSLNANVFYELGVRHSLEKPVIHVALEETDLPFDNAQHDTVFFDLTSIDSMEALSVSVGRQLDEMAKPGYAVSNPLTAALGNIHLQQSGDTRDQVLARLDERLSQLERGSPQPPLRINSGVSVAFIKNIMSRERNALAPLAIEPRLVRLVVDSLDSSDEAGAQELLRLLLHSASLTNGPELATIVWERFPEVLP